MSTVQGQETAGFFDRIPATECFKAGALAYVVGVVAVQLLFRILATDEFKSNLSEEGVGTFEMAGNIFYNAHLVDSTFSTAAGSMSVNYLTDDAEAVASAFSWPGLFWIAVIAVLFAAGYRFVQQRAYRPSSPGEAAKIGASIAIGYLPLVFIGTILFEIEYDPGMGSPTVGGPELTGAILFAGLLFPIVIAGAGGYYAQSRTQP